MPLIASRGACSTETPSASHVVCMCGSDATFLYGASMSDMCLHCCLSMQSCLRCVTEHFMSDSLHRVGYNELPGAERGLPVKQQMRLDLFSVASLLTCWQNCQSAWGGITDGPGGLLCGAGAGRQSPVPALDPTAQCFSNKRVWRLKHPKCQHFYHSADVLMLIRLYISATGAALQKRVK